MGLYADEPTLDRRAALRGLAIVLATIAIAYFTAWLTVGRAGRFQELKGVFFSLDLPESFERIGQDGSGASLTSLAEEPRLERTFAAASHPPGACRDLKAALLRAETEVYDAPDPARDAACSLSGLSGGFSVRIDVRSLPKYLDHAAASDIDAPMIPGGKRAIVSVVVRE